MAATATASLDDLRQKLVELDEREERTLEAAKANRGGLLNDQDEADLTAIEKERTETESLVAKREAFEKRERDLANRKAERAVGAGRRSQPEGGGGSTMRVEHVKANWEDDPKRGFRDHREFLSCVMAVGSGRKIDPRLIPMAAAGSDEQGAYSDPHGGFLVPVGVAPGILSIGPEADPLLDKITPITMSAPTVKFNARVDKDHTSSVSGGLTVARTPETVDGTSSRMKFDQVVLTANEEVGLAYATETILTDSPESFVAILAAGFRDEYAANAMNERINGTGVGERQGALTTPCSISVAKESGQAADTIVVENIDKMAARCWRYGEAVYLANHNTRPQLRGLVRNVGTGGSVVNYFSQSPGGAELLDGRPIFFTEFAKTVGDLGDIILGVWSQYLEGTYQTERFDESMHVRFVARERAFRFYRRNDGQWWWKSALTPKNGSTLSPVVLLAAR
jgi:HK97 family phage major capsid protein